MESTLAMNVKNGLTGVINQHSWMFLSSYENLRENIINNYGILSMLHLGPRTFEELSGEVVQSTAFVLENGRELKEATYYRLVNCKNIHEKEAAFLAGKGVYKRIKQADFSKIPGAAIAYWATEKLVELFDSKKTLTEIVDIRSGISTGNNDKYYRFWFEVNSEDIEKMAKPSIVKENELISDSKWFYIVKGGEGKKWYGNRESVINLEKNGYDIRNSGKNFRLRTPDFYHELGLTWSRISSNKIAFRLKEVDTNFGENSPCLFVDNKEHLYYLSLLNSKVVFHVLKCINPTLTFQVIDVAKIPIIHNEEEVIFKLTKESIDISRSDWNSRETSWDFEQSPLLNETNAIQQAVQNWQDKVTREFFQLHTNEEELNRIFIDIYGLQDELTPEVALKDITILQEELNKNDMVALEETFRASGSNAIELPIDKGEVISQFISYAIGLFMGRYRLDKPGLNIAHPNPTADELASYSYNNGKVTIDEDAILPLMGKNCQFPDDALQQFQQVLDTIWGHETRTENINFIQECLDKDLEKFLVKDFYKYHCKMYKKKPIYWLFASPKGAFQVLVYMHRMNAFTVEKIRANYLLEHIKNIRTEIMVLEGNASNLNTQEAKTLDRLRSDLIECEAYDMELKNVADQQISFDLDDGVKENYKLFESVVAKIK